MTIALVLSTAISLTFLGGALLISKEINKFKQLYESRINVSVFLCSKSAVGAAGSTCKASVTGPQTNALRTQLSSDPMIKSFTYISQAEATKRGEQLLGKALVQEAGTDVFPASFTLKLTDVKKDYVTVAEKYSKAAGVDSVQNQSEQLNVILNLFSSARFATQIMAFIVGICAVVLMANTIQVAAAQRRNETGIMRLVGASRLMTQLPFIIEAVIAALAGGVIAMFMMWAGVFYTLDHVFGDQVKAHVLPSLDGNDIILAGGVGLLAGIVLAALTAWSTLRLLVRL
ncbi:permease-like cell division protein FtsX [Jatrophihabitans telluris]|uniref:Cell division protein FtsX n=1 Tax=Jatrophihabitans telluris TaxID=2038343 RepID=A0ABY4R2M2_9ACTN|nr:permease-like cell division protein FtsX [Jatrophihabitans telluris]